jgi:NAD+ kinase
LKATILTDPERPKVTRAEITRILKRAGIGVSEKEADFGVVVGGDGLFSYYGRIVTADLPLLFVAVRSRGTTSTKGYLSHVYLDELPSALDSIANRRYAVSEFKRLEVAVNGTKKGEVFTDVYLEKGADSNCLRYHVEVNTGDLAFTDSAIANGVIVSTSAGSTGYYSYLDKLRLGQWLEPERFSVIREDQVGVCHIAPLLTTRAGGGRSPLRYTVPWGSTFRIRLTRDADARLFGITKSRTGIRIKVGDYVDVGPSTSMTRVIRLPSSSPNLSGKSPQ